MEYRKSRFPLCYASTQARNDLTNISIMANYDNNKKKGAPKHEAPAIAKSGKGQMYAVLSSHAERLYLGFETMTPMS